MYKWKKLEQDGSGYLYILDMGHFCLLKFYEKFDTNAGHETKFVIKINKNEIDEELGKILED